MNEVQKLVRAMRTRLEQESDPQRAAGAQAYMKSAMPYHGLNTKTLRAACKETFAAHPLCTPAQWRQAALVLWREATHREQRYAAIELTFARGYREPPFQSLDALPMYEEMIVTGAWWDYVDVVASNRVGHLLLRNYPRDMKRTMLAWAKDDDIWLRRSAIISQLRFGDQTDLALLERCIAPSLGRSEFWLRKAIGWALRQYAWTDPAWTQRYVDAHHDELSGLRRREALKNVGREKKKKKKAKTGAAR